MDKSSIAVFAIIALMVIFGFASPYTDSDAPLIGHQISEGVRYAAEAADEARNILEGAEQEAEKERLAELGYPNDYDPTNPVSNGEFSEDDWDAIQQEEAMEGLAEDAMNNYYQEKPDISDEVLKP